MPTSPWIALLKRIPAELQCQLSVVTHGGTEINVQNLLDLDGEVLAFRGRLVANQDGGRVYLIPYENIDYIGFNRMVTEEEYRTWFTAAPETNGTPATNGNAVDGSGVRSVLPNRAALLERIRARPTAAAAAQG